MKFIKRIINLISIVILIYFGFTFYHAYQTEKDGGVETNEAVQIAASDTLAKAKDGVVWIVGLFNFVDYDNASAQEAFVVARGVPNAYVIMFSDSYLDANGLVAMNDGMRRYDSWFYHLPVDSLVVFDSGYFVKEVIGDISVPGKLVNMSPLYFTSVTKVNDVIKLLGNPSCEENSQAGNNIYRTIKYIETDSRVAMSFSFSGEQIIAVTVGVVFSEDGLICK